MACFLAPAAEAVIVTAIRSYVKKKEAASAPAQTNSKERESLESGHIPFSQKLGWLLKLLWGGCFLLAIEHIWHGEVVPWPPFLTAMSNPADIQPMLMEIATVGTTMAVMITAIWVAMLLVSKHIEKKETEATVPEALEV
ncbi:MAG: hypothetical protein EOM54_05515 [Clostridia bacterium]|nr:hypothetical protein [Clostridia bacterium]